MTLSEQRYQVSQILAEGRARGFPPALTTIAVALFFRKHHLTPPVSLIEWLSDGEIEPSRNYH